MNLLARESTPLQPDQVESGQMRRIIPHHAEGNDIIHHAGAAADEGVLADANELVEPGPATDDDIVANLDMAGAHHVVREDHVIADFVVVADMRIGKEEAAVS